MTVFVGVRNNYLIWRYGIQSWCSIAAGVIVCVGVVVAVQKPVTWVALSPVVALRTSKGRGLARRCVKEVHDGVLYNLFGVFDTDKKV